MMGSCTKQDFQQSPVKAQNGVLDLRDWSFEKNGITTLDGEWVFYWDQLLEPTDFKGKTHPQKTGFFQVPGVWSNYLLDNEELPGIGYATLRLKVLLKSVESPLALKLLTMGTSYKLWIDDEPISSNGTIGKTRTQQIPQLKPQTQRFNPQKTVFNITLQIANFYHKDGGPWRSIQLGTIQDIKEEREQKLALDLFLFGALFIMGLYHFALYQLRPKDLSTLYFGLFCFLNGVRVLIVNSEQYYFSVFPDFNFELFQKINYLSLYIIVPLFVMFVKTLYPEEISRFFVRFIQSFGGIASVIVLLTPTRIFSRTLPIFGIFTIAIAVYGLWNLRISVVKKREGINWFIIGLCIIILTMTNDFAFNNRLINTGYFFPYGLFLFILTQSFILSKKLFLSFSTVETQNLELRQKDIELNEKNRSLSTINQELDSLNHTLELRVHKRTRELADKNVELSELLHVLCHDLYNPLACIHSVLDMCEEDTNRLSEFADMIELSTNSGLEIIDIVKKMRSLEEKKHPLELSYTSLGDAVTESVKLLLNRIQQKKITLDIKIDPNHQVFVEKTSFVNSVLNNILTNALKFSFSDSTIEIRSSQEGERILLSIKDFGVGMTPEELDELFDINKPTSRPGTNGETGTGFGIPLINKFINEYNGQMTIISHKKTTHSKDHGTEILVDLRAALPEVHKVVLAEKR